MARYTGLFTVAVSADRFWQLIAEVLHACSLNVIYSSDDYVVAREIPGRVSYAKLVTVEILIERIAQRDAEVRMNLVVKNEELPLQAENHCRQIFRMLNQAVEENRQWRVVASAVS